MSFQQCWQQIKFAHDWIRTVDLRCYTKSTSATPTLVTFIGATNAHGPPHPSTPDHFFHLLFKSLLKRLTAQSTTSQLFLFRDCQLISLSLSLSLVCPHLCYFTPAMSSHLNNLVSSFSALLLLIFRVAQFKTKQLCRNI